MTAATAIQRRISRPKPIALGLFLQQSRQKVGITQAEVSNHLGYSTPQFISNWERGVSSPPLNVLAILADLYKVSRAELAAEIMKYERELLEYRQRTVEQALLGT